MTGTPPRILVVDDEETIRDSLQMFLEAQGWEVLAAASAEEALVLLSRETVDGAIVDIRLPGMTGDAMIVQAHARYPDIRWLIFTGSMDFHLGPELLALGLTEQDLFAKPLGDMRLFVERFQHLLS